MRAEAEQALGDAFDIRDFHDAVLTSGGVPLETLKVVILEYIEDTRGRSRADRP